MQLTVLPQSDLPLYRQLYEQIAVQVLNGTLLPNEALPSIRFLASELKIGTVTVRNAYDALEADGYLYTQQGSGCFVATLSDEQREERIRTLLFPALTDTFQKAKQAGIREETLLAFVRQLYRS